MKKDKTAPSAEQKKAMTESGRNVLVSAAAGSGKTFTLVQRIIQNIIQGKYRIDELLVVTFTNAAAAEMRERIEKKLTEETETHPELAHQLVLLPNALISTMHSFCQRIIRDNFSSLDIDPKFRLVGEQERELIRQNVIRELFERKYEEQDESFLRFAGHYGSDRGDEPLYSLVLQLYDFAESQPAPREWISIAAESALKRSQSPLGEAKWFLRLLNYIRQVLHSCSEAAKYFAEEADHLGIYTYADTFENDNVLIGNLFQALGTEKWESIQQAFNEMPKFPNLRKPPKMELDKETAAFFSEGRKNQIKVPLETLKEEYFSVPEEMLLQDMESEGREINVLCKLTLEFMDDFQKAKKKKTLLDFNDLEHYALALLEEESVRSSLKDRFREIMVDEYQDTNGVQEAILSKLTNGENLYMVGDVKQSIYRFRLADPTLFIKKQIDYKSTGENGICVELRDNYRSRGEVLSAVNFLFSQLMISPEMEIPYDKSAALYPKADYGSSSNNDFSSSPAEVLLINDNSDTNENEAADLHGFEAEAEIIAKRLKELKNSNTYILEKETGSYRLLQWKDIAVLLRAAKGKAQILCEKLRMYDIPAYAEVDTGYFEEKEISLMLSLLSIIDNAHQDIPLAAILHSMIGKMTAEDLSRIRADAGKNTDLYTALTLAAKKDGEGKATAFIKKLDRWRVFSRRVGVAELLWQLYRDTNYYDYAGAQPGGVVRQANLRMLVDRAADYEKTNFRGLFRFLKFIRQMKDRDTDLSVARTLGEKEDVVRVMTVHKSKGLEFPVVVLADLSKSFNLKDSTQKLLIHKDLGLGMYCTKTEETLTWQYPTINWQIMKQTIRNEAIAEELRVLYVALTRAREKLILVGRIKKSIEKSAKNWCRYVKRKETPLPGYTVLGAKSWLDWIGTAIARSESGRLLCDTAGICEYEVMDYPIKEFGKPEFDIHILSVPVKTETEHEEITDEWIDCIKNLRPIPIDTNNALFSALSWKYPHYTNIPAKITVTEIKRRAHAYDKEYSTLQIAAEKTRDRHDSLQEDFPPPAFLNMEETKKGGTAFGILMHEVMQHLELDGPLDAQDIGRQLEDFMREGRLTEEEKAFVHVDTIVKFFNSPIGRRMKNAKKCWREQPFSLMFPASETDPLASPEDETFLQGTIDAFFEEDDGNFILLDYKTDRNTTPQMIKKRYQIQMDLYSRAIKAITGRDVSEKYIYRLSDGDTIAF